MKKTILVLANSVKKWHHCVAGREVIDNSGKYDLGPWIRPVSDHDEGALTGSECQLTNRKIAEVFDFVEIPLKQYINDPCQPENWEIFPKNRWISANGQYPKELTSKILEEPNDLWLEMGKKTDRISHKELILNHPDQSLYIIRPEGLRIELSKKYGKPKTRAIFNYSGEQYNLSMTDPVFSSKYCKIFPGDGEKPDIISIPSLKRCLLCVSLTGEFNRCHYKVVATIFEDATRI